MKQGDKVRHEKYGEGMIVRVYEDRPAGIAAEFRSGRYWFAPENFGEIPVVAVASWVAVA